MNRYKPLLLLMVLLLGVAAMADEDNSKNTKKIRYHKSLRLFYQAGAVLQTNSFLAGDNKTGKPIDDFHAASLQYGVETDGSKLWQQLYNYPTWGFGYYHVNFFDSDELGTPSSIYSFIDAPFFRFKRWSINYEVGFGLTYNWKPFNIETNALQFAIGSSNTVFIDAGMNASFQLGKHFDLTTGFTFTHFSNGATRVPNLGINLVAPRVGLKYIFNERPELIRKEVPVYQDNWEYIVLVALSSKQTGYKIIENNTDTTYTAETYGVFTLSTGINRQISHKVKFGAGMDIGWDGSYNSYINYTDKENVSRQNAGNGNKLSIGLYGAFELVVNQLSVVVQPGWYLYRQDWAIPEDGPIANDPTTRTSGPRRQPGGSYQRIGLKYHIWPHVFAGINVRAYDFSIADYIEWNFGYRIKWRK